MRGHTFALLGIDACGLHNSVFRDMLNIRVLLKHDQLLRIKSPRKSVENGWVPVLVRDSVAENIDHGREDRTGLEHDNVGVGNDVPGELLDRNHLS